MVEEFSFCLISFSSFLCESPLRFFRLSGVRDFVKGENVCWQAEEGKKISSNLFENGSSRARKKVVEGILRMLKQLLGAIFMLFHPQQLDNVTQA